LGSAHPRNARQIPRLRSSLPSVSPDEFFDIVKEGLNLYVASVQIPDNANPLYVHSFPKARLTKVDQAFDVITFRVLSSVPAQVGNDGTVSRRPYTFQAPDPNQTGYVIKTDQYDELLTVEFTIWSKSNPTRSRLVTWFHRFMLQYANRYKFFEGRGADKFQFVGRGEDGFETHEEQEIYFGTLTYQVKVHFLDTYSERLIDQMTVVGQLGQDQQPITVLQTA
jgi:hypothetical protein